LKELWTKIDGNSFNEVLPCWTCRVEELVLDAGKEWPRMALERITSRIDETDMLPLPISLSFAKRLAAVVAETKNTVIVENKPQFQTTVYRIMCLRKPLLKSQQLTRIKRNNMMPNPYTCKTPEPTEVRVVKFGKLSTKPVEYARQ
jgi:hypothetical protein